MAQYHHDFWTVAATVAPVLALAVVVVINRYQVIPLQSAARQRSKESKSDGSEAKQAIRKVRTLGYLLQVVAWIGFGFAAIVTIVALSSLAATPPHDVWDPADVIWMMTVSGGMLPTTTLVENFFHVAAKAAGIHPREYDPRYYGK